MMSASFTLRSASARSVSLAGDFDRAILLGDLQHLAALDVENVAGLRRFDSFALERKLDRDPRHLDRLAPPDLGVLDRLFARDVARSGVLFGGDALGGEPLLLRDAAGLNRFARGDFGGVDRAIAGDLERAHLLVARYPFRRRSCGPRGCGPISTIWREAISADSIASLRAISSPRVSLVGADAVGGDLLVERDARGLGRFAGGDLGGLDSLDALDLAASGFLLGDDALDRDLLLLGDARGLDRLARGDLGFVDRAAARDVERADALLLLDARRRHHFARGDIAFLQRTRAFDLERPGGELGGDTLGGKRLFARDAGGFLGRPCRAAISSSSIARLRAISRRRISSSSAMRSSVTTRSCAMRARSVVSRAAISACSRLRGALDLEPAVLLVLGDARRGDRELLRRYAPSRFPRAQRSRPARRRASARSRAAGLLPRGRCALR